eukprot:SAG31_NODE_1464_length_8235_cov_12.023968_7_plen_994_part_00
MSQARGAVPSATLQFASVMVLRYARSAAIASAHLDQVIQQCLELALRTDATLAASGVRASKSSAKKTQEQLFSAAAAAACRLSPTAMGAVHAQSWQLYQQQVSTGFRGNAADGLLALTLVRLLAEEAAKPAAAAVGDCSAQSALQPLCSSTLEVISWALSSGEWRDPQSGAEWAAARTLVVAGLRCLQQWITAASLTIEDVSASSPQLIEMLCKALDWNDPVLAEALAETITSFIPGLTQGAVHQNGSTISEMLASLLLVLCNAVAAQRARLDFRSERLHYGVGRATCRLAASLAAAPLPWTDHQLAPAAAGLLSLLADASGCPDRPTSALAIEGLGGLQRARHRFRSRSVGGDSEALLSAEAEASLLPALLAHARYLSAADEDLDDEEWARVRGDVLEPAALAAYCVLRLDYLQHCALELEAGLTAGNWRQVEASLFAIGSCGGPAEVRLVELADAAPKAERAASNQLLTQIFELCAEIDTDAIAKTVGHIAAAAVEADSDGIDPMEEAATCFAALLAGIARCVGHYAGWLSAHASDALLLTLLDHQLDQLLGLTFIDPEDAANMATGGPDKYAEAERRMHTCFAVEQLCRKCATRLVGLISTNDDALAKLCHAGSNWAAGDASATVAFAVCRMLLGIEPMERRQLVTELHVFGPLVVRLERLVETAAAAAASGDSNSEQATATEAGVVLRRMGAALQGLVMGLSAGLPVARACLQRAAPALQVVANAWKASETAEAMVGLLCAAVGVAEDAADDIMFEFIGGAAGALAQHHPAATATVAVQLAQTWGFAASATIDDDVDAVENRYSIVVRDLVATALLGCTATEQEEDSIAAVNCAARCLLHVPAAVVDGGGLPSATAAMAHCLGRAEPDSYSAALSCLESFQQAIEASNGTHEALLSAVAGQAKKVAFTLASSLCGRCDGEQVLRTAHLLRWLVNRFADGPMTNVGDHALQGFATAGASIGDGSGVRAALIAPDPTVWVTEAEQLWQTMR